MKSNKLIAAGLALTAFALMMGVAGAQGTLQSPGYGQANQVGACHGVFGNYYGAGALGGLGYVSSYGGATISSDEQGWNSVGSCPYDGIGSPVGFPPGSSAAGANPNSPK